MVMCESKRRAGLEASKAGTAGAVGWRTSDVLPFILCRSVCSGILARWQHMGAADMGMMSVPHVRQHGVNAMA